MKKFRNIELGSKVAFFHNAGHKKIEGSERPNGSYLSRKMYYTSPVAQGVVVKIHGHNATACRVFLDNGKEVEMGLSTHYHLNGEMCESHQDHYSIK